MACRVSEAVFSSTGFRIRATQGQAADRGMPEHDLTNHGSADHGFVAFAKRAAATLFFPFFPADCRISSSPLVQVSRLLGPTLRHGRENVREDFVVRDPARILKPDLLLVDDVVRKGTTASERARVLLRAGAARGRVATVAQAGKIFNALSLPENLSRDQRKEGSEDRLGIQARG
jgi:hypothetical protein